MIDHALLVLVEQPFPALPASGMAHWAREEEWVCQIPHVPFAVFEVTVQQARRHPRLVFKL